MSTRPSAHILPMKTAGTQHIIDRTYRESGTFQWCRESLQNAIQAGATHIEFGLEWQAVESQGIYRRVIADNGCGMTAEQLVGFFNTFGGGGKPIGGAHDNFGVGSKTSLLPWNSYGMVVVSWVNGDASMIWMKLDPESGEYGLKLETCQGDGDVISLEEVYDPYVDEVHGCDWSAIKPDWIDDHGTVIVLLGNSPTSDTVAGDPTREESDIKGISTYLNRRFWELPEGVEVYVDEVRTAERSGWPANELIAHGPPKPGHDRRTNMRQIMGAKYYIEYAVERFKDGELGPHGEIILSDRTVVHWYLWLGDRPKIHSYAAISGYIAALYQNELYDVSDHHSTYRLFGVVESSIRRKLWLIVEPPFDPEGKTGVYPKTDRNSLLIKGGAAAGAPLPINDWAGEFADNMPPELMEALRAAHNGQSGTITDESWKDKLAEKFGSRWKMLRLILKRGGSVKVTPDLTRRSKRISQPPVKPRVPSDSPNLPRPKRPASTLVFAKEGGDHDGERVMVEGGMPGYRFVREGDINPGMLAAWSPKEPEFPAGAVLINSDHPVLRSVVEHWQSQFADLHSENIAKDVLDVYGQVAVSKIAHSEHLKTLIPATTVEAELRSPTALTMSLLGLMAEDQLIATRIGGKYHRKRKTVAKARKPSPK